MQPIPSREYAVNDGERGFILLSMPRPFRSFDRSSHHSRGPWREAMAEQRNMAALLRFLSENYHRFDGFYYRLDSRHAEVVIDFCHEGQAAVLATRFPGTWSQGEPPHYNAGGSSDWLARRGDIAIRIAGVEQPKVPTYSKKEVIY